MAFGLGLLISDIALTISFWLAGMNQIPGITYGPVAEISAGFLLLGIFLISITLAHDAYHEAKGK
jgi:hypothetical protein